MSERSATSDKHYPFIKFIGVAGVVAILGAAVSLGHTQQIVEDTSDLAKRDLQQVEMLSADIKVEQQEINDVDRRVTRLEDKK